MIVFRWSNGVVKDLLKYAKILELRLSCYLTKDFFRLIPMIKPKIIQGKANLLISQFLKDNSNSRTINKKIWY